MIRKLMNASLGAVIFSSVSIIGTAYGQQTKAQLNTYNSNNITSNGQGLISGPILQQDISNIITSMCGLALPGDCILPLGTVIANLGYTPAHAGPNNDITSLSGLATPYGPLSGTNVWTGTNTFNGVLALPGNIVQGGSGDGNPGYAAEFFPTSGGTFGAPAFNLNDQAVAGFSSSDGTTHFAMAVTGNTPNTGTGSYTAFFPTQYCTNRDAGAYCTGAEEKATAVAGSSNLGNYSGNNPYIYVPTGMTGLNSAVGEETNTDIHSDVYAKEGWRFADLGGDQDGCSSDVCGIIVATKSSTAYGFKHGIRFNGEALPVDANFPIAAAGDLMIAYTTSLQLRAGIDLSNMLGGFSQAAILLPAATTGDGVHWGALGEGGGINSLTATNGGTMNFASNSTNFQFSSTNVMLIENTGEINAPLLPTSAGSGGTYVCIDSAGNLYKKASCP